MAGETFTAGAHGDLDANTVTSDFIINGSIQASSNGALVVTLAPNMTENLPDE